MPSATRAATLLSTYPEPSYVWQAAPILIAAVHAQSHSRAQQSQKHTPVGDAVELCLASDLFQFTVGHLDGEAAEHPGIGESHFSGQALEVLDVERARDALAPEHLRS